jgi:anti-sigma factor RsiW
MNCKFCKQKLVEYIEGKLPVDVKVQIEQHLLDCNECAEELKIISIAEKTIDNEKAIESNPFLITRVMAGIEEIELRKIEKQSVPAFQKVLQPILITVSLAAALFIGIIAGNLYHTKQTVSDVPTELAYMDDASLESINLLANE